jgi:hypothetical protein
VTHRPGSSRFLSGSTHRYLCKDLELWTALLDMVAAVAPSLRMELLTGSGEGLRMPDCSSKGLGSPEVPSTCTDQGGGIEAGGHVQVGRIKHVLHSVGSISFAGANIIQFH